MLFLLAPHYLVRIHNTHGCRTLSSTSCLTSFPPSISSGLRLYVLGENQEAKALGEPGELYVAGAGVARGYLKRPDLTAERFTPDPLYPGQMMYRTGDEVKWVAEEGGGGGEKKSMVLAYLGRMDSQVKINGFRIELGEIEKVLQTHHGVGGAVVCCREDVPGRPKALVAYIMPNSSGGGAAIKSPPIEDLRAHLGRSLPPYMVPDLYVFLSSFPLSPNGKVDRKALPPPMESRPSNNLTTSKLVTMGGADDGAGSGGSTTGGPNWSDQSSLSADGDDEDDDDDESDEESGLVVSKNNGGSSYRKESKSPTVNLVTRLIREQSGAEVNAFSSMSAIGLDSLGMVVILSKLSHALGGLRVPPAAVFEHETVGSFAAYLTRRIQVERPDLMESLGMNIYGGKSINQSCPVFPYRARLVFSYAKRPFILFFLSSFLVVVIICYR